MFNGSDSIRIQTDLPENEVRELVERALARLGRVRVPDKGSELEIDGNKFSDFATDVRFDGRLLTSRREGDYEIVIDYKTNPSGMCWVIAIVGFLFCLIGPLVLLMPMAAKGKISEAVDRALSDVERNLTNQRGRDRGRQTRREEESND